MAPAPQWMDPSEPFLASRDFPPLFPKLEETPFSFPGRTRAEHERALQALAEELLDPPGHRDRNRLHESLPAGYTYFGQFVIHDLTFFVPTIPLDLGGPPTDRSARAQRARRQPGTNARTPRLDLDSLYGGGPLVRPELYRRTHRAEFLLGGRADRLRAQRCRLGTQRPCGTPHEHTDLDLPRTSEGQAVIPDWRNDENTIVSQLHLGFMRAHNHLARRHRQRLRDEHRDGEEPRELLVFEHARRDLTRLYQWVVLRDWLPRLVDEQGVSLLQAIDVEGDGKPSGLEHANVGREFAIPREFVFAAGRFGHAMVRFEYALNGDAAGLLPIAPASWHTAPDGHLSSRDDLPDHWTVDWRLFLDVPAALTEGWPELRLPEGLDAAPQRARRFAPHLMERFGNLPREAPARSLPELTLRRGVEHLRLPSGNAVARSIGAEPLERELPLWPYVLHEAEAQQDGLRLGRVGSTIVLETVLGTLLSDPTSLLRKQHEWTPAELSLGGDGERVGLAHLLLLDPDARPDD